MNSNNTVHDITSSRFDKLLAAFLAALRHIATTKHIRPIKSLITALCFFAIVPAASASPVSLEATYVITVGGNIVADMRVDLDDTGDTYTIDLNANIAGLGRILVGGSANIGVTGNSSNAEYVGEESLLRTHTTDGTLQVDVKYQNSDVSAFVVVPPLAPRVDLVPIERSQLRGVNDMLSAFIIQGTALDSSVCNRRLKVFNGLERFNLDMRYASSETATSARTGYQGPVVLCQIDYHPISGHYTTSEITNYLENSDRILIWYAPIQNSHTFIPYRVLVGTSLGDLSMVLTRLN